VNIFKKSVTYARNRVPCQWRQFSANSIWGKILRKTSNLGQNFAENGLTGRNWQNIMGFG